MIARKPNPSDVLDDLLAVLGATPDVVQRLACERLLERAIDCACSEGIVDGEGAERERATRLRAITTGARP